MHRRVLCLILILPLHVVADTTPYCEDPAVIQDWEQQVKQNAASDNWQRLHAMWLGLCDKVRQENIDQNRASRLFEDERERILRLEKRRQHDSIHPFG